MNQHCGRSIVRVPEGEFVSALANALPPDWYRLVLSSPSTSDTTYRLSLDLVPEGIQFTAIDLPARFEAGTGEHEGLIGLKGGRQWDLNITLYRPTKHRPDDCKVFVFSNGAGLMGNMADLLFRDVNIVGTIDLKREFIAQKIEDGLEMVLAGCPDVNVIAVNIISGSCRGSALAEAIESFLDRSREKTPIIVVRFSGPEMPEGLSRLNDLATRNNKLHLAGSTSELIGKVKQLCTGRPVEVRTLPALNCLVAESLMIRAPKGVSLDPNNYLGLPFSIETTFGTRNQTRVGVLGSGPTALFQTKAMRDSGTNVIWVSSPNASRVVLPEGVSVASEVKAAVDSAGPVEVVVDYAPARHFLAAVEDLIAGNSGARLVLIAAENVEDKVAQTGLSKLSEAGISVLGPNSPGLMIVDDSTEGPLLYKLGNMPTHIFKKAGGLSVIGRSGTMVFDIVEEASKQGIGMRMACCIGGDTVRGMGFLEMLLLLEKDPKTDTIVLIGEAGGLSELEAGQMVAKGLITKPVIAVINGCSLPGGVKAGHQGAVNRDGGADPHLKVEYLRKTGIMCVGSAEIAAALCLNVGSFRQELLELRKRCLWEGIKKNIRNESDSPSETEDIFNFLYDQLDHWRLQTGQLQSPKKVAALIQLLQEITLDQAKVAVEIIGKENLQSAWIKSVDYACDLFELIAEIGVEQFRAIVEDSLGVTEFRKGFASTPWAGANIISEIVEIGQAKFNAVVESSFGTDSFREKFAKSPWNTTHAVRSLNNIGIDRFVGLRDRYNLVVPDQADFVKVCFNANPWVAVRLVGGMCHVAEDHQTRFSDSLRADPALKAKVFNLGATNPQALLDAGKTAVLLGAKVEGGFANCLVTVVRLANTERPTLVNERTRVEALEDYAKLKEKVLRGAAFERGAREQPSSAAQALRLIGNSDVSVSGGVRKFLAIVETHQKFLADETAYGLAVQRNPWMAMQFLLAIEKISGSDMQYLVEEVLTRDIFSHCLKEHQWGIGKFFNGVASKIGIARFKEAYAGLCTIREFAEAFRVAVSRNPRDAIEFLEVSGWLNEERRTMLYRKSDFIEALMDRFRNYPRNASHILNALARLPEHEFASVLTQSNLADRVRSDGFAVVNEMRRSLVIP